MYVLLVDDDPDIRTIIRRGLESSGHSVCEANGARTALQSLQSTAADLIVSDLFMPEGDGLELLRDVQRQFPGLRVIIVSSGGTRGVCDMLPAARHLGAHAVLRKPVKLPELLDIVERAGKRTSIVTALSS